MNGTLDLPLGLRMAFFDVYNLFNTNAAQALTTSSGGSWLRPIAITRPRILRIGGRMDW